MRHRLTRVFGMMTLAATLVLTTLAVTGVASATTVTSGRISLTSSTDNGIQPQWKRYHQKDFRVPAGQACAFTLFGKVLYDREYYRTLYRWPNGKPRSQLFRGPLVVRFSNTETHVHLIRNLSGVGIEKFNPDGSFHALVLVSGHFSATLPPGSSPRRGEFYVSGQGATVVAHADGTDTLKLGSHGRAENLCRPLSQPKAPSPRRS